MERLNPLESVVIIYKNMGRKFIVYSGRASRLEFWTYFVCNLILLNLIYLLGVIYVFALWIYHEVGILDEKVFNGLLVFGNILYMVAIVLIIATIILSAIRRLHNIPRPATLILLNFIPVIGQIVLMVFMVEPGSPQSNLHGEPPSHPEYLYKNDGTMP